MRWIDRAREVAKEYRGNCEELKKMEEYLNPSPVRFSGGAVRAGRVPRPTEDAAEKRAAEARHLYLLQSTNAVEAAMIAVLQKPQGDVTIRLINMLYYNKSHTLSGAAQMLHISDRTAKRYNKYFLKTIAESMGYIKLH